LEEFLNAGEPPVYVGFGSMGGREPERLAGLIFEALLESGQRGVLLTGWGGIRAQAIPENVFVLESAPHRWLFPRMAAVVHHGGAGTTAEGLRAGAPSVIVPFILDQPFWGRRVEALGAGPAPIHQKRLTAGNLSRAIHSAVTDAGIRGRAAALGKAIRDEDGVGEAVKIIQQILRG
jgi:sterol 3beta-glucosyltransferase